MGKIIQNVQLTEGERTCVYISTLTGRILGFGHERMKFMGTGFKRIVLFHAKEIERYAEQFRKEQEEDRQSEDYFRTERERPARNAIKAALRARLSHVSPLDRAYIEANLRLMDIREERASKKKETACLLSEKHESNASALDIALASPAFKADFGKMAQGAAVDMLKAERETLQ